MIEPTLEATTSEDHRLNKATQGYLICLVKEALPINYTVWCGLWHLFVTRNYENCAELDVNRNERLISWNIRPGYLTPDDWLQYSINIHRRKPDMILDLSDEKAIKENINKALINLGLV